MGFSFNGIHSSQLGITRVSDGDRYEEQLFPEINDRNNEISGNDGELYFGSEFRNKPINIEIAFDSMTELQFRKLRRLFGTKKICELIFDERPYKVYYVKLASPIDLKYVCFDEPLKQDLPAREGIRVVDRDGDHITRETIYPSTYVVDENGHLVTERIYKGEGTIELVAYYPFAKQLYKVLDYYSEGGSMLTSYNNVDEWAQSSGILDLATYTNPNYNIDKTIIFNNSSEFNLKIPVYNPGDLDTGFYLYLPFNQSGKILPGPYKSINEEKYYIKIAGDNNSLILDEIVRKGDDTGIMINTVNHLIEGVKYDQVTERADHRTKTWITTRNLYNDSIVIGDFPIIRRSDWYFDDEQFKQAIYLNVAVTQGNEDKIQINYDYLYF